MTALLPKGALSSSRRVLPSALWHSRDGGSYFPSSLAAARGNSGDDGMLSPQSPVIAASASDRVLPVTDRLGAARCLTRSMTARAVDPCPARAFSFGGKMKAPRKPSRLQDTVSFRSDWANGVAVADIGSKVDLTGRTVTHMAMRYGYPRRDRDHKILGDMPDHPAVDAPVQDLPKSAAAPEVERAEDVIRQTHPRWPVEYDAAILKTGGKYSRMANLSRSLGRSVNAILGRWHQLRAM
jgi:hypothetical protein